MSTLVELFNEICADSSARERVVLQDGNRQWTLGEVSVAAF